MTIKLILLKVYKIKHFYKKFLDSFVTTSSKIHDDIVPISEDDIRKSLIVEAKRRKYWTTKAIAKMVFEEIEQSKCYHV